MFDQLSVIKNQNSTVKLVDEKIFHVRYSDNLRAEIIDFEETYSAYETISKGSPMLVLAELGKYASATTEAREFAQKNKLPAKAEALVINSLAQRMLFNFYAKFRRQKHPINSFKNYESAFKWLISIDV